MHIQGELRSPALHEVESCYTPATKFRVNAERILTTKKIESAVNAMLKLEEMDNICELMEMVSL
ncbi:hypothetical protein ACFLW6_01060 [Chloroflexota bacterium]